MFQIKEIIKGNYFKNFLTLITGSLLAQFITIASSPVLSRLYSPSDFGYFSVYTSYVAILSVIACLRYELAILLPKEIKKSFELVKISIIISFVSGIILLVAVLSYGIKNNFGTNNFFIILPIISIATAVTSSLNYFHNRIGQIKINSIGRIVQSLATIVISLLLYRQKYLNGLAVGAFLGLLINSIYLILFLPYNYRRKLFNFKGIDRLKKVALEYKTFPYHSLPPALLNIISSQAIIFFLISNFGSSNTGNYFFAARIILLPASLLSSTFSDVFYQDVIKRKMNLNVLMPFFIKNSLYLFALAISFSVPMFVISPFLFKLFFGAKWVVAGELGRIILFSFIVRFVVSPLTIIFTALDKIVIGGKWQIVYFILYLICILILYFFKITFVNSIIIITVLEVFIYLVGFILLFHIIKSHDNKIIYQQDLIHG